jgi:hypothetical protein
MLGGKPFVLNFDEVVSEGTGGRPLDDLCLTILARVVPVEPVHMSTGRVRLSSQAWSSLSMLSILRYSTYGPELITA